MSQSLIFFGFPVNQDNQNSQDNQDNHDNHNNHDNHDNGDNHDHHNNQDNQVRLAYLWVEFRVILFWISFNIS